MTPGAAALAIVLDRALGEPPDALHPVAWFGSAMQRVERGLYADDRARGAAHAATGAAIGLVAGLATPATVAATVSIAGRMLERAAHDVRDALVAGDVERARTLLPSLVGRDPTHLDEKEICRAVVESVAENSVDAVVAPALWAAIAGSPGVLAHRAVNTMDAMVGHHSARYERYGWVAARLDDIAAYVPARVTALLVLAVRPRRARPIVHAVRRDAPAHPSPNSGVAEAAFAAALDLRLGGETRYPGGRVELRPSLGAGRPPDAHDITRATALLRDVSGALALALGSVAIGRRWR